jgi:hypothetical protein
MVYSSPQDLRLAFLDVLEYGVIRPGYSYEVRYLLVEAVDEVVVLLQLELPLSLLLLLPPNEFLPVDNHLYFLIGGEGVEVLNHLPECSYLSLSLTILNHCLQLLHQLDLLLTYVDVLGYSLNLLLFT